MSRLVNVGFGNMVSSDKVIAIISPDSAPAKRQVQMAKENHTLIDATQGRKTKSIIFTIGDRLILSALQPDTLAGRFHNTDTITEEKE